MVATDLHYLRARTRKRGDRSVSLLSATLGSALDIKPILHCNRGETGPVGKVKGTDAACERLFDFAGKRIRAGLMTRSEEHTSELQSLMRISYAVFCLKKKTKPPTYSTETTINN